jgi:hypothetical protein
LICFSLVALLNISQTKNQNDTTMEDTAAPVLKSRYPAGIHPAIAQNGFEYRISEGSVKDQRRMIKLRGSYTRNKFPQEIKNQSKTLYHECYRPATSH